MALSAGGGALSNVVGCSCLRLELERHDSLATWPSAAPHRTSVTSTMMRCLRAPRRTSPSPSPRRRHRRRRRRPGFSGSGFFAHSITTARRDTAVGPFMGMPTPEPGAMVSRVVVPSEQSTAPLFHLGSAAALRPSTRFHLIFPPIIQHPISRVSCSLCLGTKRRAAAAVSDELAVVLQPDLRGGGLGTELHKAQSGSGSGRSVVQHEVAAAALKVEAHSGVACDACGPDYISATEPLYSTKLPSEPCISRRALPPIEIRCSPAVRLSPGASELAPASVGAGTEPVTTKTWPGRSLP
jgi:hypothetical protein